MTGDFYVGRRLSYGGSRCTVRYVGPVEGQEGEWLGVEWDDPTRGKHRGQHKAVTYFECRSKMPTAASFIRPSRKQDASRGFLDALREKYSSDTEGPRQTRNYRPITFGSKVAEEVGFEKIRQKLAVLQELRVVILDGMCIRGLLDHARCVKGENDSEITDEILAEIKETCPKVVELDLSRNLIEDWDDIVCICQALPELRCLRLNGTRFNDKALQNFLENSPRSIPTLEILELNETFLTWQQVTSLTAYTPSITSLSLSDNDLDVLDSPLPLPQLNSLALSSNHLTSIRSIECLTALPKLAVLRLPHNGLSTLTRLSKPFETISKLNLSHNCISSFTDLSNLPVLAPNLTNLIVTQNPYSVSLNPDTSYMLTLGRLPKVNSLNHTTVTEQDHINADLYYLSSIGHELSTTDPDREAEILKAHPRYQELCSIYGEPTVVRAAKGAVDPDTLAGRMIHFSFYIYTEGNVASNSGIAAVKQINHADARLTHTSNPSTEQRTITRDLPRTIDTYRLKGVVGRLFSIPPYRLRLIYETGEWDPISQSTAAFPSSDSEQSDDEEGDGSEGTTTKGATGLWTRRETELADGTREVGFWIEGLEATVRLELREI